jgi:hypothetical protein
MVLGGLRLLVDRGGGRNLTLRRRIREQNRWLRRCLHVGRSVMFC